MIKVSHHNVEIKGQAELVLTEFTMLIRELNEVLTEKFDEKFAREQIAEAGRLAFLTPEELNDMYVARLKEVLGHLEGKDNEE